MTAATQRRPDHCLWGLAGEGPGPLRPGDGAPRVLSPPGCTAHASEEQPPRHGPASCAVDLHTCGMRARSPACRHPARHDPREDTARGPPREPTQDSALGRIRPPREQPGGVDRVPPTPRVYSELLLAISSLEKSQTHCEQLWGQRVTSLDHRCSDTIVWIGLRPRTLRRPRRNELHDPASLRWVKVQTVPLSAQLTAASSPLRKHLEFVPSPGTGGRFLRRRRW